MFYTLGNGHNLKISPSYLHAKGYTMGSIGAYYNKKYENMMVDVQYATDNHNLRYHIINQGTKSIFRDPLARFQTVNGLSFDEAIERAGTGSVIGDSLTWFQDYKGMGHFVDYQFNTDIGFANHQIGIVSGIDYESLDPKSGRTMFDDNGWDYFRDEEVTDAKDVKEYRIGSYIQFDTDLRKNLSITGSARYDYHEYFGEFLSPKLAIVKDKFINGSLKLMIGRGFRAPSLAERWVYSGTKNYVTGNISGSEYVLHAMAFGNRNGFTLNNYVNNNYNEEFTDTNENGTWEYTEPNSFVYDEGDSLIYSREVKPLKLEITNTIELSYLGLLKKNLIFEMGAYVSEYENFKTSLQHIATTGMWYFSTDQTGNFPNQGPPSYPPVYAPTDPTMIEIIEDERSQVLPTNVVALTYTSLPVKTTVWGFETGIKYYSDKFDLDLNYTHFNDQDLKNKREKGEKYRKFLAYDFSVNNGVWEEGEDFDDLNGNDTWDEGESFTPGIAELAQYANDGGLKQYEDFILIYGNTPNHQLNFSITVHNLFLKDLSVVLQTRAVSEFEFKSGWFQATKDGDGGSKPIYRESQTFYRDRGPVGGGFYSNLDINYQLKENYSIGFSVKNIFESDAISFPLSPKQPRYFVFETGYRF